MERLEGCALSELPGLGEFFLNAGVLPILHHSLSRLGLAVPECILSAGPRNAFLRNVLVAQRRNKALESVIRVCNGEQIPILVLRTPHLVERIHRGNFGLRGYRDIDLALLPGDLVRFVGALRTAEIPAVPMDADSNSIHRKAALGSRLEVEIAGQPFDIHWDLSLHYNFYRSARLARFQERIWKRAVPKSSPAGGYYVLSDADLLCHLIEHAAIQHDLSGFLYRNLLEIGSLCSEVMRAGGLSEAHRLAQERRSSIAFSAILSGLEHVFDLGPSVAEINRFGALGPRTCVREVETRIQTIWPRAGEGAGVRGIVDVEESARISSVLVEGLDQRLGMAKAIAIPPKRLVEYSAGTTLTWARYVMSIVRHFARIQRFVPAILYLLRGQIWDVWHKSLRNNGVPALNTESANVHWLSLDRRDYRLRTLSRRTLRQLQELLRSEESTSSIEAGENQPGRFGL